MKRDMDLVRELLLEIDNAPELDGQRWLPGENISIEGCSPEEICYHLNMLVEAGYITGKIAMAMPVISKLTWQGHELLDDIRDPDIWAKTKEKAKAISGIGIALMWELAKAEIKKKLGI
ncbi:MAG: DUF2513 domain-containing protein [Candidatus Angelobacter sp.]